jgi:hypothetical protein
LGEDARLFACRLTKPVDISNLLRLLELIG